MDDDLHRHISALVEEEHALRSAEAPDRARLRALEEDLDRTWDLLRQRQARREAGLDPSGAAERRTDVVEGYLS